ncbi:ankyrin repeat and protein kinase domain-containing protein 1-like [Lingula anatina]|uniref:Ankyrin repeat and protein kinase domain-containing protein 1-like n=1 Tax=Lingula anatina TaxID=7574 RepID=A0A2R2MKE2_LINAN|nr:ankyrin repeat and protein kinase domain-containing protein 1-like [Lingula anatina]|eukprot:XP_023930670.1 ankyrin repeat and protein kinase domain-containing protein 1-like [Lingula anatina]
MADERLLWAASDGDIQSLQELLTAGECDVNDQDWKGWTPLHWAALYGHTQCVQLLHQHGADTNIQDKNGWTPLHLAVWCSPKQCVQLLLQHGADTNIQSENGWTPLHWAAFWGHTQCIQLLLQHGADTSIQNKERKTPRMMAEDEEHAAVVELLRRFEIPDIQGYVQTRTLEHLAELLDPAEYTIINQTNLSTNFPDVFQFQKVQELKDWANQNNCTHIRDLKDRLQDSNLLRLSSK